jgi:hypothetical protein
VPRYFFDLWEAGDLIRDDEGSELSDLSQARSIAADTLGSIMRDIGLDNGRAGECSMSVRDATGVVFTVAASNVLAQAAQDESTDRAQDARRST